MKCSWSWKVPCSATTHGTDQLVPLWKLGLVVLAFLAISQDNLWAGDKKKPDDPFPRKEKIFKTFVNEFVAITPGKNKFPATFEMGSKNGGPDEQPVHKVTLAAPFAIAKYEVTQELYHVVMGENPSKWKGPRNSVEMTTWQDSTTFCKKVTEELRQRKLIAADEEIRLPSEAEWEYCCRAGTTTAYSFGDKVQDLTDYAWYKENSKGNDPPVGVKKPNAWGLYDMHGYIWEWCADDWHPNYKNAPTNGLYRSIPRSLKKVIRGGSWATNAAQCRCAARAPMAVTGKDDKIGFRCVRAKVRKMKEGEVNDAQ
ncbi:MAG: formylglycine-generating enzyme family protein [Gemmataceae bacterium]